MKIVYVVSALLAGFVYAVYLIHLNRTGQSDVLLLHLVAIIGISWFLVRYRKRRRIHRQFEAMRQYDES